MGIKDLQKGMCVKTSTSMQRTESLQKHWNNPVPDEPIISLDRLKGCYSQLLAEVHELNDIINSMEARGLSQSNQKEDIDEVSDNILDIIEYSQQLAVNCGITDKVEKDSYLIYENNWTKVCETEELAKETQMMYLKDGLDTYIDKNKNGFYVVKCVNTGHVKKPVGFEKVVLS